MTKPMIVNMDQKVDIEEVEHLTDAEFLQGDESGSGEGTYCWICC